MVWRVPAVKRLLILRHAKSDWSDPRSPDHDRPLNKRGKRDADRMGRLLREEKLVPDLILSSTARRARDTASGIAAASGFPGKVKQTKAFYLAGPSAFLKALRAVPDKHESVMVVGHNPGLEELVETLTGQAVELPTAALAEVSLPIDRWRELRATTKGTLVNLWRPRHLADPSP